MKCLLCNRTSNERICAVCGDAMIALSVAGDTSIVGAKMLEAVKMRFGRQKEFETRLDDATERPASPGLKTKQAAPGAPIENGRQNASETHGACATARPAKRPLKPKSLVPGAPIQRRTK